jgi:flagellar assembly factor FliW
MEHLLQILPNLDVLFHHFEEYKVPTNITITNPFNLKVEFNSSVPSTKIQKDIQVDYQHGTNKRMHEHLVVDGQGVPTLAKYP